MKSSKMFPLTLQSSDDSGLKSSTRWEYESFVASIYLSIRNLVLYGKIKQTQWFAIQKHSKDVEHIIQFRDA